MGEVLAASGEGRARVVLAVGLTLCLAAGGAPRHPIPWALAVEPRGLLSEQGWGRC